MPGHPLRRQALFSSPASQTDSNVFRKRTAQLRESRAICGRRRGKPAQPSSPDLSGLFDFPSSSSESAEQIIRAGRIPNHGNRDNTVERLERPGNPCREARQRLRLDNLVADGVTNQLADSVQLKFAHDVSAVGLSRLHANT